ncbi:NfeD family protein [Lichenifustis flavocetrariae]|uniref:NfeD family protein n=1 Tax=Lichenifustis flavocetrariae TaxID=2949735 RepID=A0AA42CQ43_9HYPH|nr:NfeD family protein [Lichenifustis flavocetrariae]MCW6511072.1 NfeD family protein [Lichenifustis flavocetrariae]
MSALALGIGASWCWIIAGLGLAIGEVIAPGIFLIWLGLACLATGLVVAATAPSWPVQVIVFALLAPVAALLGRRLMRNPPPTLNRRGHDLVGREVVLDTPIHNGVGRLPQGDTSWRLVGPDLAAGTRVRIVRMDGVTLVVEPV